MCKFLFSSAGAKFESVREQEYEMRTGRWVTLRELYNKFHATYDLHMASTCDAKPVVLMFDVKEKKKQKNPRGNTGVTEFSRHVHFLKPFFFLFLIGSMRRIKNILQYLDLLAGA